MQIFIKYVSLIEIAKDGYVHVHTSVCVAPNPFLLNDMFEPINRHESTVTKKLTTV